MQDALKAALLLSVAHMLVTGASHADAYTKKKEKLYTFLLKAFTRSDTGTSSTEEGAIDTTPQNKDEALYTWILIASIVVTLAVVICNAVAASQDKDEDDAKHGLESAACVIAVCVLVGLLYMYNKTGTEYNNRKNWTMFGVFLYTFFTAIAVIV